MRLTDNCHRKALQVGGEKQDGMASSAAVKKLTHPFLLNLDTYQRSGKLLHFFRQDGDKDSVRRNAQDELILSVAAGVGEELLITTGNYVGRVMHNGVQFDIRPRFGDAFMRRMLNFANDIFIDDSYSPSEKVSSAPDHARILLYLLFVGALEKAFQLGLPKTYHDVRYHEGAVRGRIDIARFIRSDIPYRGLIGSVAREQRESQAVVDVLAKAVRCIESDGGADLLEPIAHVRTHLSERRSSAAVSTVIIEHAKRDKALLNPLYASYKRLLDMAEMIIRADATDAREEGKLRNHSFLINVAELFEIYVGKLLARRFPDWHVSSPKIDLHTGRFYERKIIPDIVMEHDDGRIAVFDTKYKRMHYAGRNHYGAGDVDRNDFFQIATYMAYYRQRTDRTLVLGGLLYPLLDEPDLERCYDGWMMDDTVDFVIDGIRAGGDSTFAFEEIVASEDAFVGRIDALLGARS